MVRRIGGLVLTALAALALAGVGSRAGAATNNLTSVQSVASGQIGSWYCGYQGNVTTTDKDTLVRRVIVVINNVSDGSATYIQQESGNSLIWDYHDHSTSTYPYGTGCYVKTVATVVPPTGPTVYVTSGTIFWIAGY